jgi:hypothetical protein
MFVVMMMSKVLLMMPSEYPQCKLVKLLTFQKMDEKYLNIALIWEVVKAYGST